MAYLPRGIDPELLLSQVKNTMPYLFATENSEKFAHFAPALVLKEYDPKASGPLSHYDYFKLCLCSHYLSCGTPVPTDVDNQIRYKLWPAHLPLDVALQMAQLILESRKWDFTLVSRRFNYGAKDSPWQSQTLNGHMGEWFTVSIAAYCALKQNYKDPLAQEKSRELFENIADEIRRHSEIFGSLWNTGDGLGCLKGSASIAHNFGDLDRVVDMWNLDMGDPLRLNFYKLAILPFDSNGKLRFLGRLWVAGELYKSPLDGRSIALENHRHFALRKPRCLRQSPALLIPNGPFFDHWGKSVAEELGSPSGAFSENLLEVIDALIHGWARLPKTVGYGRALHGIAETFPDLVAEYQPKSSPRDHQDILKMPQERFEKKWNDGALKLMDDIPSRA